MAKMNEKYQKCMEDFIDIYRSETCLWHVKSKDYHNQRVRNKAYGKLVQKLQEIEPSATKETVVKKINNIRTNYRKELRRVRASMTVSSPGDEIYEPKLWYYKSLCFLQELPRKGDLSDEDEPQIKKHDSMENMWNIYEPEAAICTQDENSVEYSPGAPSSPPQHHSRPLKRKLLASAKSDTLIKDQSLSGIADFRRPPRPPPQAPTPPHEDDRFELFGKHVSMRLRDLPKQQMLLAEKIINDTLFEAEMGNLTLSHAVSPRSHRDPPYHFISASQMYQKDCGGRAASSSPSSMQ